MRHIDGIAYWSRKSAIVQLKYGVLSCGPYMDPSGMSRHGGVAEEQRQMHAYIRLLAESLRDFRALMTSARARLIDLSASEALSHSRIWARRSDLFPHH